MKISPSKEIVTKVLEAHPSSRDDYYRLVSYVWHAEMVAMGMDIDKSSTRDMLLLIKNKKLSNPESITRARRKIQEQREDLRGSSYEYRKNQEQTAVVQDIKTM